MSDNDKYICRLNNKHLVKMSLRNMALHMGMTNEESHEDWRKRNGLPAKMDDMRSVHKKLSEIEKAIIKDETTFSRF